MKTFKAKRTDWQGFWYKNDSHTYISNVIDLSDLKDFNGKVRFLARKNKFYKKDTKRPNMQFCIVDSNSTGNADTFDIEDVEPTWRVAEENKILKRAISKIEDEEYINIYDAIQVARDLVYDHEYGYSIDDLVVEVEGFMREKAVTIDEIISVEERNRINELCEDEDDDY